MDDIPVKCCTLDIPGMRNNKLGWGHGTTKTRAMENDTRTHRHRCDRQDTAGPIGARRRYPTATSSSRRRSCHCAVIVEAADDEKGTKRNEGRCRRAVARSYRATMRVVWWRWMRKPGMGDMDFYSLSNKWLGFPVEIKRCHLLFGSTGFQL